MGASGAGGGAECPFHDLVPLLDSTISSAAHTIRCQGSGFRPLGSLVVRSIVPSGYVLQPGLYNIKSSQSWCPGPYTLYHNAKTFIDEALTSSTIGIMHNFLAKIFISD